MSHRFHRRFGTVGVVLGVVALILALPAGAAAKGGLTGKQKKEVKSIAKQYAGKNGKDGATGPAGPLGAAGPQGPGGANGTNGSNGTDGNDGTGAAATEFSGAAHNCPNGGLEVTSANPVTYVCNGTNGSNGTNGKTVLNGTEAPPSNAIGTEGDFYLNTASDVLYGPKGATTWPGSGVSLKGNAGIDGKSVVVTTFTGGSEPAGNPCAGAGGLTVEVETSGVPHYVCNGTSGGGGGSGTVEEVIGGFGLLGGTITTTGELSVNEAIFQRRLTNNCASGEALTGIAQDGTPSCAPISGESGGTVTKVEAGTGLEVEGGGDITTEGKLKVDFSETQQRVSGECTTGQAVKKVNQDGTVECETTGGAAACPANASGKLASGCTETGVWGFGQFELEEEGEARVPLSFPIPYSGQITASHIIYIPTGVGGNKDPTHCPGTVTKPESVSGYLCIYPSGSLSGAELEINNTTGVLSTEYYTQFSNPSGITAGVVLWPYNPEGEGARIASGMGTFALTG